MSSTARVLVSWLAVAMLAGAVAGAQTAPAAPPAPAAPRIDAPARHLIWRVSKDGRTIAFLVGAIHVLSKASYPLPAAFDAAYRQSSVLVEELDLGAAPDPAGVAALAAGALLPDGQTLALLLDAATYRRVTAKAAGAGVPMMLLDRMKPWLVAVTLTVPDLQRAGFDPAQGLDRHFYERARADAKPVRGLETMAYQLDRLNGLSMPVQIEMLRAMLDDVDAQVKSVEDIIAGWRTGDVEALERLLLKEFKEAPEVYERLLVERNRNWVPAIAECLPTAPCLVVVGGAHLLGPDSVVVLLGRAGFAVEQQ